VGGGGRGGGGAGGVGGGGGGGAVWWGGGGRERLSKNLRLEKNNKSNPDQRAIEARVRAAIL